MTSIPQNHNRFLTIAPKEAKQGRAVFPCRGKFPAISSEDGGHGCEDATTDEAIIQEWARLFPDANAGITFRHSSLEIGLDIDTENLDKFQALAKEHGQEKFNTRAVKTGGGGYHFYFLRPQGVTLRNISKDEGLGFELKSNNQYLIAPGSIHPETGKEYRLIADKPCEPLPGWIVALATAPSTKTQTTQQPHKPIKKLTNAWHSELIAHIGRMRAKGLAEDEITNLALALNHDSGDDPLPDDEVIKMVREYAHQSKVNDDGSPKSDRLTDMGNGERLARNYGDIIRYCFDNNQWLIWNGKVWVWDSGGYIKVLAKKTARSIYNEAAQATDSKEAEAIAKYAHTSEGEARLSAMVALAQSEPGIPVKIADLNKNKWLLNCLNGTIDLKTGKLQAHNPADLITLQVPAEYQTEADAPTWLTFLNTFTSGDAKLQSYLQRAVGYSLTGNTGAQVVFLIYGLGSNGKSTFCTTIRELLDGYAARLDAEDLMLAERHNRGQAKEGLADIQGKRFVVGSELQDGRQLNTSLLKDISGQDTIKARRLYSHEVEFMPECKVWLYGNHKPIVRDTTVSIWRRIKLIHCTANITESERIDDYFERYLKPELSGILAWAVQGCLDWQKEGLKDIETIKSATASYRTDEDDLGTFIEDCCVLEVDALIVKKELKALYSKWLEDTKADGITSQKIFKARLLEKGIVDGFTSDKKSRAWLGIRARTPLDDTDITDNSDKIIASSGHLPLDLPKLSIEDTTRKESYGENQSEMSEMSENPAEPSVELPNCLCGELAWTMTPTAWKCGKCGHEIPIQGGIR